MRFLTTGISLSLIFIIFSNSCSRTIIDYNYYREYVFKNELDHSIRIDAIYIVSIEDTSKNQIFTYEIGPKKRLLQEIELTFGDKKDAIASADLISIVFGNQKKVSFKFNADSKYNILNLKNYTVDSLSFNREKYTYTFTEEDYRNATPLVFGEGFVGSVWRCTEGAGLQEGLAYNELRFVSESQVEGWVQLEGAPEQELFFTATYSIEGETVTISEEGARFTATLNETFTSLVTNIDSKGECVFIKQ